LRDTPSAFKDKNIFVFESALSVAWVQLTVSGVLSVVGRAKEFYGVISCWSDW
jgi:hypothetical protein